MAAATQKKGRGGFKAKNKKQDILQKTRMRTIWVTTPTAPFTDEYDLGKQLGQPGQFGHAYRCRKKGKKEYSAVKVIAKKRFYHIKREARVRLLHSMQSEITILQSLNHPYVVKMEDVYEDKKYLYIVMEECSGGELFEHIVQRGHYSERDAAKVIRMIVEALEYMHDNAQVVHCDLKPDNILFANKSRDSPIKIIDFGMSKVLPRLQSLNELVGTPYYTAPEILDRAYTHSADMWSVGVIMYVMLFGYPPFYVDPKRYGKNEAKAIYAKIRNGFQPIVKRGYGPWFPENMPVSEAARDLMARLMASRVEQRLTAKEAREHRWLSENGAPSRALNNFVDRISKFTTDCKFKTGIIALFRENFMELQRDAFDNLREQFNTMDTDKDGIITYEDFSRGLQGIGLTAEQTKQLFSHLNVSDEGTICFADVLDAAVHDYLIACDERLYAAFRDLDHDDDGYILTSDLVSKMRETDKLGTFADENAIQQFISEADLDNDGKIDYEEFLRALHPNFNEAPDVVSPTSPNDS